MGFLETMMLIVLTVFLILACVLLTVVIISLTITVIGDLIDRFRDWKAWRDLEKK